MSVIPSINSRLITTKLLAYLDSKVPGRSLGVYTVTLTGPASGSPGSQAPMTFALSANGSQLGVYNQPSAVLLNGTTASFTARWNGTTENFVRIGHSLFALLAGWLGGLLSRRLGRSSQRPDESTPIIASNTP